MLLLPASTRLVWEALFKRVLDGSRWPEDRVRPREKIYNSASEGECDIALSMAVCGIQNFSKEFVGRVDRTIPCIWSSQYVGDLMS